MKYRIDGMVYTPPRHGSRVDGSMWVATIAAMLMVFAAGVFVGWLV